MTRISGHAFQRLIPSRIVVALIVVGPCIISLSMGYAENILTAEGVVVTINLVITVLLLAGLFLSARHTLAFVHVAAIWLILIFAQIAKLSSGTIREGYYFYPVFQLSDIVVANLSIAIWLVTFAIAYLQTYRFVKFQDKRIAVIGSRTIVFAVLLAIAALSYLYIRLGGIVATRAAFDVRFSAESTIAAHLVEYPLRAIPFYAIGVCILAFGGLAPGWRRKIMGVVTVLLVAGTVIINNPVAASRFFLGVTAIGVLYLIALRRSRSNLPILVILCFGVFFVLSLDFGRSSLDLQDALVNLHWSPEKVFLNDMFSTFESVPAAVRFIEEHGTTLWWQLIGNLLFFVPRSFWPEKPVGSGAFMVGSEFGSSTFSNVSCAAPCEGLINFGLLGVIVLAAVLGIVLGYMDKKQTCVRSLGERPRAFTLFYAFFIGHVFFITRGDLLSPLAIIVSMSLAYIALRPFALRKAFPLLQRSRAGLP